MSTRLAPALALALALAAAAPAAAHVGLWDPAMFGWNASDPNQNDAVAPLYNLTFADWWFHGYIDQPPADGTFMSLPAGGVYHGQVSCNKAFTSYGDSSAQEALYWACDTIGPLHTTDAYGTADPVDVTGCALSIAYESDEEQVEPQDFAVVSANYSCPWTKDVDFTIPADLPACPAGGCLCQWNWIHADDSGSEQIYVLMYRCNVTGATATEPLPAVPTKCDYPTDTTNCTTGPRQPLYWLQAERNNIMNGYYDPPVYNGAYGFMNGAQTDLFSGSANTSSTASAAASSAASASSPAAASASSSGAAATASVGLAAHAGLAAALSASASASASTGTATASSPTSSAATSAVYSGAYGGNPSASASAAASSTAAACRRRRRRELDDPGRVRGVSRGVR